MKLKVTGGRVVHSPLSYSFNMLELGGSYIQKYDAVSGTYIPDRNLTPYTMKPQLVISDPDGNIPAGEYSSALVNVLWVVTLYKNGKGTSLSMGKDYVVDTVNALKVLRNVAVDETVSVEFSADYLNKVRSETAHFSWSKTLSTMEETSVNLSLEVRAPHKMDFSPFKRYGKFPIEAVLRNGSDVVDEGKCIYKWQTFDDDNKVWRDIDDTDDLWYVSGKSGPCIVVDQDFLQHTLLRIVAYAKAYPDSVFSDAILLRRWYGQWEDTPQFLYAKFLQKGMRKTAVSVKITNRQGDVANPFKFFDVELFYRSSPQAKWESMGNVTEAVVDGEKLTANHEVGDICRELSAFQRILMPDGTELQDAAGLPVTAQFPTSAKEVE